MTKSIEDKKKIGATNKDMTAVITVEIIAGY